MLRSIILLTFWGVWVGFRVPCTLNPRDSGRHYDIRGPWRDELSTWVVVKIRVPFPKGPKDPIIRCSALG